MGHIIEKVKNMKKKGFKIVLTVLLVLALAAGGYLLWVYKPWEKPENPDESNISVESEEESEESKEKFPASTSRDLGLYAFPSPDGSRCVVDATGTRQSDYMVDEDGNIRTVLGEPVIAAENAEVYSVVTEIIGLKENYTVELTLYKIGENSYVFYTGYLELPLSLGDAVDTRITVEDTGETPDLCGLYEGNILGVYVVHSGERTVIIRNASGDAIAEFTVTGVLTDYTGELTDNEFECLAAIPVSCEHNYFVTTVPASYEEGGRTIHECVWCGHVYYSDVTDPLPCEHIWGDEEVVPATCAAGGYTSRTCTICGKEERSNETEATAHSFGDEKTVAPTCAAGGYTVRTCTICGKEERANETAASAHTWGEATVVAPTCTSEGYSVHTCTVCGAKEQFNTKAKAAHTYTDTVVAPTYTAKGYTEHVCSVCGYTYRDHETAKLTCPGHNYEVTEQTAATCTAKGRTVKVCSICGKTETTETAALGHTWSAWTETVPATEEATGTKERTCSRCGASETETIPKICLHHEADEAGWYGYYGPNDVWGVSNPQYSPCAVDSSHTNCPYTYYWYATCRKCGETFYRQATQYDQIAQGHDSLVLDRLYYYLNQYRATYAGLGPLTRDSRFELYSEIRADQLVTNYGHNYADMIAAEAQAQTVGTGCGECIAYQSGASVRTVDHCAAAFIDAFYHSSAHWAILTASYFSYVGIGYNANGNVCIEVSEYSGAESHQMYLDSLNNGD